MVNVPRLVRIHTPTVYRLMPSEFVRTFFETGALRLSSFSRFRKHTDERRDDEGRQCVFGRAPNRTFVGVASFGGDGYVLCGSSAYPDAALLQRFNSDAAIQIFNTSAFAAEVALQVQGFTGAWEGACSYRNPFLEFKLEDADISALTDDTRSFSTLAQLAYRSAGSAVLFQKSRAFLSESEYRWFFTVEGNAQEHLDINVPDARKYCMPWYPDALSPTLSTV